MATAIDREKENRTLYVLMLLLVIGILVMFAGVGVWFYRHPPSVIPLTAPLVV